MAVAEGHHHQAGASRSADEIIGREFITLSSATLDALSAHICVINEHGDIIITNRAWREFARMNGASGDTGEGANYFAVCEAAARRGIKEAEVFLAQTRQVLSGERDGMVWEYSCHSPGEQRWFTARVNMFVAGGSRCAVIAHENITQRKAAELLVSESRDHYLRILQSAPALIWRSGIDAKCDWFNDSWLQFTGRMMEEEVGDGWATGVHPDDLERCVGIYLTSFNERIPFEMEYRLRRGDGQYRWILDIGRPNSLVDGTFLGYIGYCFDITETKEMMDDLKKAKEAAEAANVAKTAFLANMSHEIRTPLNGVIGIVQLLSLTELDNLQRDYIECIKVSADSLLAVINDVLDLSKVEAGHMEIVHAEFDPRKTLDEVLKSQAPRVQSKSLALSAQISPEVPDVLIGDQLKLKQVLLNLVGNALKFTECGQIEVHIQTVERQDARIVLKFTVHDTGIGIVPEVLESIFSPFTQGDSSINRKHGGTGLGLAICRRLTELMGGRIWAESIAGSGSFFHFTLPFDVPATPRISCARSVASSLLSSSFQGRTLRVLVADDQAINLKLAAAVVEKMGHVPVPATNGNHVLDLLERERFDLILMDVQMPHMDGIEATRIIREREKEGGLAPIPIIAITAHAFAEDRERLLRSGFDGYISKPIKLAAVQEEMDRCVSVAKVTA